jgi:hypothetical protein
MLRNYLKASGSKTNGNWKRIEIACVGASKLHAWAHRVARKVALLTSEHSGASVAASAVGANTALA